MSLVVHTNLKGPDAGVGSFTQGKLPHRHLAAERPVLKHGSQWIMVDDDRFPFETGDQAGMRLGRFRTLGCWPPTAAIASDADAVKAVIAETFDARSSERQGRMIDSNLLGSGERKKQEGYF